MFQNLKRNRAVSIAFKILFSAFLSLRSNRFTRNLVLRILAGMHNFSYKTIGLFASHSGTHPKHEITGYHRFFTDNVNENDVVLDIGCGKGDVAFDLAKKSKHVIGVDISEKNIEACRKKYGGADNLEFVLGDATCYDFKTGFDVVVLSNVLEHIENRVDFLKKLGVLSPLLLIRVPLITRDWISVYKKNIGLEYRLSKDHCIEYTEENFRGEIENSGMKIDRQYVKFGELFAVVSKI